MHNKEQRQQLHDIAYDSIKSGLSVGKVLDIDSSTLDDVLQINRATFVTLQINNQLRGCIGMLEPIRPLAEKGGATVRETLIRSGVLDG